jgi:hypothetical protein
MVNDTTTTAQSWQAFWFALKGKLPLSATSVAMPLALSLGDGPTLNRATSFIARTQMGK